MPYILLTICCSLIVSILLKLAKRYHIDVLQAVTWNYSTAIFLTWLIFKPHISQQLSVHSNIYLPIGILLPVLFLIIAASVRVTGIVRTDVAQRLSLVIPIIAAFWVFNEVPNILKIIGIVTGVLAILCTIPWNLHAGRAGKMAWVYLLIIFVGIGVLDVLFKQIALFKDVPYTTSLCLVFTLSFITSLFILIVQIVRKKTKFSFPHILIGWVLGIANFGNILFFIKAHIALSGSPLVVFSTVNIGVIITGAIVGLAVFREKLSLTNKIGIALAIIAIIIIANA